MNNSLRMILAWILGTSVFLLGMVIIEKQYLSICAGLDIHFTGDVWFCEHAVDLWIVVSLVAGIASGLLCRTRGLAIGALVAIAGLVAFSFVGVMYPLGSDHMATVQHGFFDFVFPSALACVLGARLASGQWKNAL